MFKMIKSPGAVRAIAAVLFVATLLAAGEARAQRLCETASMPVFFSIPDRDVEETKDFPLRDPGVDLDRVSSVFIESFIVFFEREIAPGAPIQDIGGDSIFLNLSLVDREGRELIVFPEIAPFWTGREALVFEAGLFGCAAGGAGSCEPLGNPGVARALRITGLVRTDLPSKNPNFVFELFGNAPQDMLTLRFFRGRESLDDAAGTHAVRELREVPEQCTTPCPWRQSPAAANCPMAPSEVVMKTTLEASMSP